MEYRVSYKTEKGYGHKGGLKSVQEARAWIYDHSNMTALKILVWEEDIQCFSTVIDFREGKTI